MKHSSVASKSRQHGVTLIVSLFFMIILAMLGVAIANVSILEERMAGNTRNRDLAFQAAEAALRDAEAQLNTSAFRATAFPAWDLTHSNSATYWDTCFAGTAAPCATKYTPTLSLPTSGNGALVAQPQFIVEKRDLGGGNADYRVTARAVGGTSDTVVVLQSEFHFEATP
jgi:type IV pilus assembly protein PilX